MDPRNSQGPDRIDYRENPGDLTEVHAAIQREHRDPSVESTPMPLWLTAVCGAALVWAGGYFMTFHGGLRSDVFNERLSSPDILFPEAVKPGAAKGPAAEAAVPLAQAGKAVYANCQPCHQTTGQGTPVIPTLVGTDYVKSEKRLIAILLKGIQGELTVNGTKFTGVMPAWEKSLNDKKIAQVASYVRAAFGNNFPETSEAKVAAVRKEYAAQAQPWTEAELLQMPADVSMPDVGGAAPAPAAPAGAAAPAAAAPAPAAPVAPAADLMAMGKKEYMLCQACHQPSGMGLPPAFPPLGKSEYVIGDPKRLVAIMLKGVMGPITVSGTQYNSVMPGQELALNNQKAAAIATYVRNSFGNSASPVTPELVAEVRKELQSRTTPFTEAELKAMEGAGAAAPAAAPAP